MSSPASLRSVVRRSNTASTWASKGVGLFPHYRGRTTGCSGEISSIYHLSLLLKFLLLESCNPLDVGLLMKWCSSSLSNMGCCVIVPYVLCFGV